MATAPSPATVAHSQAINNWKNPKMDDNFCSLCGCVRVQESQKKGDTTKRETEALHAKRQWMLYTAEKKF